MRRSSDYLARGPYASPSRWARWLLAIPMAAAVGMGAAPIGCAAPPPRENPELEANVPDRFAAADQAGASDGEPVAEWWNRFGDRSMTEFIRRVMLRNPTLDAASARLVQAEAQARIAGADNLPQIAAGFNAGRQRTVITSIPISAEQTTFGINIDISWEADVWGRIRDTESAAMSDIQAAAIDYRGGMLSLSGQTSKAWVSAIEARLQVELASEQIASLKETLAGIEIRFSEGVRSATDIRLARTQLAAAEAALAARERAYEIAIRQLEILAGDYPAGLLEVSAELPTLPAMPPVGRPSEILVRRPDMAALERRLAASNLRVDAARKALLPALSFSASVGSTAASDFGNLFNSSNFIWSFFGNIFAPIFQGGRLRANVQLNEGVAQELFATYAQTALRAFYEVESVLAVEDDLAAQEAALRVAVDEAMASRELARDRYNSGLDNVLPVLQAERSMLDTRTQLLAVQRQRLTNRIDLHLAIGSGFEEEVRAEPVRDAEETDEDAADGDADAATSN